MKFLIILSMVVATTLAMPNNYGPVPKTEFKIESLPVAPAPVKVASYGPPAEIKVASYGPPAEIKVASYGPPPEKKVASYAAPAPVVPVRIEKTHYEITHTPEVKVASSYGYEAPASYGYKAPAAPVVVRQPVYEAPRTTVAPRVYEIPKTSISYEAPKVAYEAPKVAYETPKAASYESPAYSAYEQPKVAPAYGAAELKEGGKVIPILRHIHEDDTRGHIKSHFETDHGITQVESGTLKDLNLKEGPVHVKSGQYSYTGPDGKKYTTQWTADEHGFHVSGEHLPTPPPMPEEIKKSLALPRLPEHLLAGPPGEGEILHPESHLTPAAEGYGGYGHEEKVVRKESRY